MGVGAVLSLGLARWMTSPLRGDETEQALREARQAERILASEASALESWLSTWTHAPEVHDLLTAPAGSASTPLADTALYTLDFDWLMLTDRSGMVRFRRHSDPSTGAERRTTSAMLAAFQRVAGWRKQVEPGTPVRACGLVEGTPLMIVTSPVPGANGSREEAGTAYAGRWLDGARLARLRSLSGVPFALHTEEFARAAVEPGDEEERLDTGRPSGFIGPPIVRLVAEQRTSDAAGMERLLRLAFLGAVALLGWLRWRHQRREGHTESVQRQMERLTRAVVEQSEEGVLLLEPRTHVVVQSNAAARRLAGVRPTASWDDWVAPLLGAGFPWEDVLNGPLAVEREIHRTGSDAMLRDLEVRASRLALVGQTLVHVGVRDVSDRKRAEAEMRHQAYHDPLTHLPNRLLFHEHVSAAVARAEREGDAVAVLVIDLDDFKAVNDTLGHHVGDQLLVLVGQRLTGAVRAGDIVARQGGDEFMVLLPRLVPPETAHGVAERLLAAMRAPFRLEGRDLSVAASIGISLFPQDGRDTAILYRNADVAMYHAKRTDRGGCQLHDAEMNDRSADLLELKGELVAALEKDQLDVHYQPIVEAATGRIVALEALVRWTHPTRGPLPPGRFLPMAEETGLIVALGDWVFRRVCRQQVAWRKAGLPDVRLAVNLSARQIFVPELVETIRRILAETGATASSIEFEVTETVAIRNARVAQDVLARLKELGFSIALDDFGTGYSALVYLRQFPFDRLKIDRAFVHDLVESSGNRSIVSAIVALAHSLNLDVVAEGVEQPRQAEVLRDLGCDLLQGFGLARPAPAAEAQRLLERGVLTCHAEPSELADVSADEKRVGVGAHA
jgi:diguanylate cyclase (GGDEF)-like protein